MSRSLPLGTPATSPEPLSIASAERLETPSAPLHGRVEIYDPAMCCSTGLCGPGVDPALLRIARDLRWLVSQSVVVNRFGLSQEPHAFVANARVTGLMQAFGDTALPAVLVNDVVLSHGRYPTREELVSALGAPSRASDVECCEPGSGCCT